MQRKKTDLSSACKSLIRGGKCKWVGAWHYFVFTSKCYSIGMCKFACFKVEINIGKLVFCRDVSYSHIPVETLISLCYFHKNQLNLMGLVHAMCSNGPLPQVTHSTHGTNNRLTHIGWRPMQNWNRWRSCRTKNTLMSFMFSMWWTAGCSFHLCFMCDHSFHQQ